MWNTEGCKDDSMKLCDPGRFGLGLLRLQILFDLRVAFEPYKLTKKLNVLDF